MSEPQSTLASTQRRLTDLRTFQLPRLATCRGPLELHRELAEEMRGDLEHVRRTIELARELGESLGNSAERDRVIQLCAHLDDELFTLRMAYRQALVASKKKIASNSRRRHEFVDGENGSGTANREREGNADEEGGLVMGGGAKRGGREEKVDIGVDDPLLTTSSDLTSALLRTTNLLQLELDKSVLSVQTLQQSTQTLRLTNSLYENYTALLHTSGQIVRSLERADWWDRAVIAAAFLLFLCVVGWVIKRRVFDRVVGGVLGVSGWWLTGSWRLVRILAGGVGGGAKGVGKVGVGLGKAGVGLGKVGMRVGKAGAAAGKQLGGTAGMAGIAGAGSIAKGSKQIDDVGSNGPDQVPEVEKESGRILDQLVPPEPGNAHDGRAVKQMQRTRMDTDPQPEKEEPSDEIRRPGDTGRIPATTSPENQGVDQLLRSDIVEGDGGLHSLEADGEADDPSTGGSRGAVRLKIRDRDEL